MNWDVRIVDVGGGEWDVEDYVTKLAAEAKTADQALAELEEWAETCIIGNDGYSDDDGRLPREVAFVRSPARNDIVTELYVEYPDGGGIAATSYAVITAYDDGRDEGDSGDSGDGEGDE